MEQIPTWATKSANSSPMPTRHSEESTSRSSSPKLSDGPSQAKDKDWTTVLTANSVRAIVKTSDRNFPSNTRLLLYEKMGGDGSSQKKIVWHALPGDQISREIVMWPINRANGLHLDVVPPNKHTPKNTLAKAMLEIETGTPVRASDAEPGRRVRAIQTTRIHMRNNEPLRLVPLANRTLQTAKHGRQTIPVPSLFAHPDKQRVPTVTATTKPRRPGPSQYNHRRTHAPGAVRRAVFPHQ